MHSHSPLHNKSNYHCSVNALNDQVVFYLWDNTNIENLHRHTNTEVHAWFHVIPLYVYSFFESSAGTMHPATLNEKSGGYYRMLIWYPLFISIRNTKNNQRL